MHNRLRARSIIRSFSAEFSMDRVVYCIANRQNVLGGVRVITCHHVIRRLSSELHVSRSHPQAVCIHCIQ